MIGLLFLCLYEMIDLKWDLKFCFLLMNEFFGIICCNKYVVIVVKIFMSCIVGNDIKNIL